MITEDLGPEHPFSYNTATQAEKVPLELLPTFAEMAHGDGPARFHGVLMLRKLLSVKVPPCAAVVEAGAVPLLCYALGEDAQPALQEEAAWAIANVTGDAPDHARLVVELGATRRLLKLLSSDRPTTRRHAARAIGNIAGVSAAYRDFLLGLDGVAHVTQAAVTDAPIETLLEVTWALLLLCRGSPAPDLEAVAGAFPTLARLAKHPEWRVAGAAKRALAALRDGAIAAAAEDPDGSGTTPAMNGSFESRVTLHLVEATTAGGLPAPQTEVIARTPDARPETPFGTSVADSRDRPHTLD